MTDVELRDEANFEKEPATVAAMAVDAGMNGPAGTGAAAGAPGISGPAPQSTIDILLQAVVEEYEKGPWWLVDLEDKKRAAAIREGVIRKANMTADAYNAGLPKEKRFHIPQQIPVQVACEIIRITGDVACLVAGKEQAGTLVYYNHIGEKVGIWTDDTSSGGKRLRRLLGNLDVPMTERRYGENELTAVVDELTANESTTQIPMANGVVDISGPNGFVFTPYLTDDGYENQDYVDLYGRDAHFTHKNAAKWNPNASNITLHCKDGMPWSVDDHLDAVLAGNENAKKVWWQSCNFVLRGIAGGRAMWYMDDSEKGQGGGAKSTTAMMIGAIIGQEAVLDINMDQMQQQFGLARLVGKRLLIGHETNAGTKGIESTDVIKRIMRCEPVSVERKFVDAFTYKPRCMTIQCLNTKSPKIKEKEAAFYRKIIPMYFPATLTEGVQHDEIHDELIYDQRVIDYIAFKALSLGPISQYDPDAVEHLRRAIDDIRAASSTVFQFYDENADTFANNEIPLKLLFVCYNSWCAENRYNGVNFTNFESDTRNWTGMGEHWKLVNYKSSNGDPARRVPRNFKSEEIIARYGSLDMRENKDMSNTSVEDGAGTLSKNAKKEQHRKWLVRVGEKENEKEQELAATLDILKCYAEFRAVFSFAYADQIQANKLGVPGPDLWCRLGRPMPYYTMLNPSGPLTHQNFDFRGFRTMDGDIDYGLGLDTYCQMYCKMKPLDLVEAVVRGKLPKCSEDMIRQTCNRLCGIKPEEKKT